MRNLIQSYSILIKREFNIKIIIILYDRDPPVMG